MEAGGFELRFDLAGRAAVRVAGGPVAARHVEPAPPSAPWVIEARCGAARGWLLAHAAPPDPERSQVELDHVVAQRAALALQALAGQGTAAGREALARLTHRLSTDVMTLQTVAEAALHDLFDAADRAALPAEIERTSRDAQQRLTDTRAVLSVLEPLSRRVPEAIADTLRDELEVAGRTVAVEAPGDERPLTLIAGAGWAASARRLAEDERLTGFVVAPDPAGWRVSAGPNGDSVDWTEPELGALTHAGHIVLAAGGSVSATRDAHGALGISFVVPAAPPE